MNARRNALLGAASALVILAAGPAVAQDDATVTIIEEEGPAERTGEAIDRGAEATGEAARDAARTVERAGDEAGTVTVREAGDDDDEDVDVSVERVEPGSADGAETAGFVDGVIMEQSTEDELASALMDASVVSNAGEEIGSINDMIIGTDGRIRGVVIGVGGFLGLGEKDVALDRATLERSMDSDGDVVWVLDATTEELEAAPDFRTRAEIEREADAVRPGMEGPAGTGVAPGEGMAPATGTGTGTGTGTAQ